MSIICQLCHIKPNFPNRHNVFRKSTIRDNIEQSVNHIFLPNREHRFQAIQTKPKVKIRLVTECWRKRERESDGIIFLSHFLAHDKYP